jgi:signal transduction histidine kinase
MMPPTISDELRATFLFERLTDEQLTWIAERGEVTVYDAGARVYDEGEPATCFYVLLEGGVRLTRRVGREEVETGRTEQPGVYAGATRAFVPASEAQTYQNTLETTRPSRFFKLPAEAFAELMATWFPMAVHLLEGLYLGIRTAEATVRQREKLAALGALSAGLAHELNNPASAGTRAASQLRERVAGMRHKLGLLAEGRLDPTRLRRLVALQEEAIEAAAKAPALGALEEADREDAIAEWLDEHDIAGSWELAPVFVAAGLDTAFLDRVAEESPQRTCEGALRWLAYALETEALMHEVEDATSRISTLVSAVKEYSYMDRAPHQDVDVHQGLDSTLVMLGHKLADVQVVKDYDRSLPPVPAYGGELNQVWTNLIDNAVDAMKAGARNGAGTLTLRTSRDAASVLVEVADDGPGIPDELAERIFQPFFTTKRLGEGSGLGLDVCKRIVETRHGGTLTVTSRPGDTVFHVRLPLTAPATASRA